MADITLENTLKLSILTPIEFSTRVIVGDAMKLIQDTSVEETDEEDTNQYLVEVMNTKPGKYKAIYTEGFFNPIGRRIMDLSLIHESAYADRDRITPRVLELRTPITVDSGLCGVYDYRGIASILSQENGPDNWNKRWEHKVDPMKVDIYGGCCAVSASGFGAGDYNMRIYQGEDMRVLAIKLFFISPYEFITEEE